VGYLDEGRALYERLYLVKDPSPLLLQEVAPRSREALLPLVTELPRRWVFSETQKP